jgi:hypothetical protein
MPSDDPVTQGSAGPAESPVFSRDFCGTKKDGNLGKIVIYSVSECYMKIGLILTPGIPTEIKDL